MNVSLPDRMKSFVDEQVAGRGYGTSSEYIWELIRKDQNRQDLRNLLLEGVLDHRALLRRQEHIRLLLAVVIDALDKLPVLGQPAREKRKLLSVD